MATYISHDQINQLLFWRDAQTGAVFNYNKRTGNPNDFLVLSPGACDSRVYNLLAAASLMYQLHTEHFQCLETFLRIAEATPNANSMSKFIAALTEMQNGILNVQFIAREGLDKIANQQQAQKKAGYHATS
jgi:hypothetical protein